MKTLATLLLAGMAMACKPESVTCIDELKINKEAICTMIYKPVCGCDDKTYGNECEAMNAGVVTWTDGECSDG